jgi:hypothetical protein
MDNEKIQKVCDDVRKRLSRDVSAEVTDSSVTKELLVDLMDEVGLVTDRKKYKLQKRHLP